MKEIFPPSSAIPLLQMCKHFSLQWEAERCYLLYWSIASPHHLLSTLFAPVLRAAIKDCLICYWSSLLFQANLGYQLKPSDQPCAAVQWVWEDSNASSSAFLIFISRSCFVHDIFMISGVEMKSLYVHTCKNQCYTFFFLLMIFHSNKLFLSSQGSA